MSKKSIQLKICVADDDDDDDDVVAYLYLPDHPKESEPIYGIVNKQIRLLDLIKDYKGPDIYLDFNKSGTLIGIEII